MNHDDPVMPLLSTLPLPALDPVLSQKLRRAAHAELAQVKLRRARRPWLDLSLAAVACAVAVLHTGWALTFVSGLYR